MTLEDVGDAVLRVLEFPPALLSSSPEDSEVTWSVLAQVKGPSLQVVASSAPTTFTPMTYPQPTLVPHGGFDSAEVLGAAALRLSLDVSHRAIPFVLRNDRKPRVCAMACAPPLAAQMVALGHRFDATSSLQAVVLGKSEFAVVGVDGHSARFGVVTERGRLETIRRADLDVDLMSLRLGEVECSWNLTAVSPEVIERVAARFLQLGIEVRRCS